VKRRREEEEEEEDDDDKKEKKKKKKNKKTEASAEIREDPSPPAAAATRVSWNLFSPVNSFTFTNSFPHSDQLPVPSLTVTNNRFFPALSQTLIHTFLC
jgi:hypothetical protein